MVVFFKVEFCGILNGLPFIKMILWRSGMTKFAVANSRVNQDQIVKRSAVLHVCVQNKKKFTHDFTMYQLKFVDEICDSYR